MAKDDMQQGERVKLWVEACSKALEEMHKRVAETQQAAKDARDSARQAQRAVHEVDFDVGDFVLRAWQVRRAGDKLLTNWKGPYRVTKRYDDLCNVFAVQDLITGQTVDVHATRLKRYHDASLKVTEELKEAILQNQQGFEIECIKVHRYNETMAEWEMLVAWFGFAAEEDTWEPIMALAQDAPNIVRKYIEKQKCKPEYTQLRNSLSS